jgi:hypothetical protein
MSSWRHQQRQQVSWIIFWSISADKLWQKFHFILHIRRREKRDWQQQVPPREQKGSPHQMRPRALAIIVFLMGYIHTCHISSYQSFCSIQQQTYMLVSEQKIFSPVPTVTRATSVAFLLWPEIFTAKSSKSRARN